MFDMPQFASPYLIISAIVVIPVIWLFIRRTRRKKQSLPFPALLIIRSMKRSPIKPLLRYLPFILTLVVFLLLAVVLARPQSVSKGQDVITEGIDLVMVLDISASMLAQDFQPDRIGATKALTADFIRQRPNDRIGIVLFAKQAFTQCPLTIDHDILLELLNGVEIGLADPDNTAIGQALASALNRLKTSDSKSRVIILLTDGENNFGLPPTTAAEAAEALGVRVYTVGVGSKGTAPYPMTGMFGNTIMRQVPVSIDEDLLREIASSTGGRYFRATDNKKLEQIFNEIDQMEKVKIEVRAFRRYSELYLPWAIAALILLAASFMLSLVVTRGVV